MATTQRLEEWLIDNQHIWHGRRMPYLNRGNHSDAYAQVYNSSRRYEVRGNTGPVVEWSRREAFEVTTSGLWLHNRACYHTLRPTEPIYAASDLILTVVEFWHLLEDFYTSEFFNTFEDGVGIDITLTLHNTAGRSLLAIPQDHFFMSWPHNNICRAPYIRREWSMSTNELRIRAWECAQAFISTVFEHFNISYYTNLEALLSPLYTERYPRRAELR